MSETPDPIAVLREALSAVQAGRAPLPNVHRRFANADAALVFHAEQHLAALLDELEQLRAAADTAGDFHLDEITCIKMVWKPIGSRWVILLRDTQLAGLEFDSVRGALAYLRSDVGKAAVAKAGAK
jgi:hypothetical protein